MFWFFTYDEFTMLKMSACADSWYLPKRNSFRKPASIWFWRS